MKLKTASMLGAVTLALGLGTAANAAYITGSINFSSGAGTGLTLRASGGGDTTDKGLAVGVNNWGTPQVDLTNGTFTLVPNGTPAIFATPWIFNPSTVTPALWTVTGGGTTFTFNLTSSMILSQSAPGASPGLQFLTVAGTGTVSAPGYQTSSGTWSFSPSGTSGPTGNQFSWSGSSTSVPDGGTTMTLLGGALLGLAGLRRKFKSC